METTDTTMQQQGERHVQKQPCRSARFLFIVLVATGAAGCAVTIGAPQAETEPVAEPPPSSSIIQVDHAASDSTQYAHLSDLYLLTTRRYYLPADTVQVRLANRSSDTLRASLCAARLEQRLGSRWQRLTLMHSRPCPPTTLRLLPDSVAHHRFAFQAALAPGLYRFVVPVVAEGGAGGEALVEGNAFYVREKIPVAPVCAPYASGAERSGEERLRCVAQHVPGFGGFYRTWSDSLFVFLTQLDQQAAERAVMLYDPYEQLQPIFGDSLLVVPVQGQYDYLQLTRWRSRIHEALGPAVSLSVRLRENRLRVCVYEVYEEAKLDSLRADLRRLGVPDDAARVEACPFDRGATLHHGSLHEESMALALTLEIVGNEHRVGEPVLLRPKYVHARERLDTATEPSHRAGEFPRRLGPPRRRLHAPGYRWKRPKPEPTELGGTRCVRRCRRCECDAPVVTGVMPTGGCR